MIWVYRAIFWIPFLATMAILAALFWQKIYQGLKEKTIKKATLAVLIIFGLQMIAKMIFFYFLARDSTLGKYLLATPGYLSQNLFYISQSYLQNLLVGIIFTLIAVIVLKLYKKPVFEKIDLWVIFLVSFVASFPGVFVMIIFALIVMIIVQVYLKVIKHKNHYRLDPIPFMLSGTIVVGILNSFDFYLDFLKALKLI